VVSPFREAHARLEEAERQLGLFDVRVGDWCAWPTVRTQVQTWMTGAEFAKTSLPHSPGRRIGSLMNTLLHDAPARLRLHSAERVFNTHTSSLTYRRRDAYGDLLMDELITYFADSVVLETVNTEAFATRRPAIGARYLTSRSYLAEAAAVRRLIGREADAPANAIVECLHSFLGDGPWDGSWIRATIAHFCATRRAYCAFFHSVSPRQMLVSDWSQHGLIAAALEHDVDVIELQHGVFDRFHGAYGWSDAANHVRRHIPVANKLLLFGDHWCDELESCHFWDDRTTAVGSLPMERARARLVGTSRRAEVVFTSQGVAPDAMTEFLRQFMLLSSADIRLAIKLHPVYDGDAASFRAAFSGNPRVRILGSGDATSSLDLIAGALLHASVSSTSHFEAVALGTPTVILPFDSWDNVATLHDSGLAMLAETPEALVRATERAASWEYPRDVAAYYFRPGARENMIAALSAH